jgi:TetR/AcrR family transcriptional repressor of bet genes
MVEPGAAIARSSAAAPARAARRQELIAAAIASISEHGLSRTTVSKVAQAAGLSQGIVNFYFESKEALLLATLEHVESEFERVRRTALARAGNAPERRLDAIVEATFDPSVCNPRFTAVWNAFWGEAGARADYMRVCAGREVAELEETLMLFRAIAKREPQAHVDPEALGTAFFHLLESIPEPFDPVERYDLEGAKRICRAFLASVFPAAFPPASGARRSPRRGAQ